MTRLQTFIRWLDGSSPNKDLAPEINKSQRVAKIQLTKSHLEMLVKKKTITLNLPDVQIQLTLSKDKSPSFDDFNLDDFSDLKYMFRDFFKR
jgi:hypothetical protein